jgi:large subunit ribosomal protein L29
MKPQKANDLRALKPAELEQKLAEARENLRKLVIRKATRQLEDTVSVRVARRDIARIATLIG